MVEVKFCGLTREADASHAASLGATYVGVIFAGGPRELAPARAAEVLAAAGPGVQRVGVFGPDFRERVPAVAPRVALDVVQLHGDPTPTDVADARRMLTGKVWAAVRLRGPELPTMLAELFDSADTVLFDSRVEGRLGGSGLTLDWSLLASAIAQRRGAGGQVALAGGLTPGNVLDAITAIHPAIVDVSSGVESAPGVKDHAQMAAFAAAVQRSYR